MKKDDSNITGIRPYRSRLVTLNGVVWHLYRSCIVVVNLQMVEVESKFGLSYGGIIPDRHFCLVFLGAGDDVDTPIAGGGHKDVFKLTI